MGTLCAKETSRDRHEFDYAVEKKSGAAIAPPSEPQLLLVRSEHLEYARILGHAHPPLAPQVTVTVAHEAAPAVVQY